MSRIIATVVTAAAALIAVAFAVAQEPPAMPQPEKEHAWLQQLAGEWDCEGEALTEPGKPPTKCKGSESSRMLGGFWYQSELKSEMMGMPVIGHLTLGFDPAKKRYIGTWIDNCGSHLWQYVGSLDAAGKVLTLETEGPSMEDPTKTCKFREVIEVKDKDHKTFSSSMEKDGKWVTFVTFKYTRKK